MKHMHDQRGVALLTAVLIVAIFAGLSIYLAWDRTLALRRTQDMLDMDRARELCLATEAQAAHDLAETANQTEVDLTQSWAQPMPFTRSGDGEIAHQIEDLQGRFNLNNILVGNTVEATSKRRFQQLLAVNGIDPSKIDAVLDWEDMDEIPRGISGAEDDLYMGMQPPYRAANEPFVSASSLRLVYGFDATSYASIAPWVTALPSHTKINMNTAPAAVLQAIGLQEQSIKEVRKRQQSLPYTRPSAFQARLAASPGVTDFSGLGVKSRYFLLHAVARVGQVRETLYSEMEVVNKHRVKILMRSWNTRP